MGYLPSDNSIYISFRGAARSECGAIDEDYTLTDYYMWPECNCQVHRGYQRTAEYF
jgi:hypothetical protein